MRLSVTHYESLIETVESAAFPRVCHTFTLNFEKMPRILNCLTGAELCICKEHCAKKGVNGAEVLVAKF